MLHFLTAVVGSTCDVRVKNGTVYEGIFKTLSSQCELAVDAVHKRSEGATGDGGGGSEGGGGGGGQSTLPKIEEITDTMIFSPTDLVTMTCRDVDLNFAIKDTFTDTAISSSRVNGDIREKVLQRWDGGDINGENYDLEADTSNGWDANEMFKFNEEAYGVKSTYDSSLSMYTVPLERGSSEVYRQREARAARLASEIESSLQYRRRVSLENDEGRSEEDRYSAVVREREERGSPGFNSGGREGKYIPLPQRARDISMSASSGRGGASARSGAPSSSRHSAPSSSSPRPSSDRSSPLSVRTACSPHQSQSSLPAASSPPCSNHSLPHSLSHPQALADTTRSSVNGGIEADRSRDGRDFFCNFANLIPSSSPSAAPSSSEPPQPGPIQAADSSPSSTSSTTPPKSANSPSSQDLQQTPEGATSTTAPTATTPTPTAPAIPQAAGPDGQLTGTPQPAGTPGSEEPRPESTWPDTSCTCLFMLTSFCVALGPVVGPRPEHHASPASPMIPAASATGPPLVASPYPQSYLQYGQVIQAMPPHYHGQAVYSMLQGGARMLTSGAPQPMGPPGPQYPGQAEGPPGPQQALYAAQSFSHHSGSMHPPQPSSTPTGSQAPPQHTAPSPGHNQQSSQGGPQPQSIYHSGGLSAPTPPNLPPGHSSPQASYPMQGYSLPAHQAMPHGFPAISQLTQAHVAGGMSGPHHNASHGPPPVMLHYAPPQQGAGSTPQHGPPPQQGAPQHYYIGPPQGEHVQQRLIHFY
uniref:Ataxin 2-like n=1 Tax=Myripristis murdjan TaxID=586833 RepID=A0A667WY88_9TELE